MYSCATKRVYKVVSRQNKITGTIARDAKEHYQTAAREDTELGKGGDSPCPCIGSPLDHSDASRNGSSHWSALREGDSLLLYKAVVFSFSCSLVIMFDGVQIFHCSSFHCSLR